MHVRRMRAHRVLATALTVTLTAIVLQVIPAAAADHSTHNAVRGWGDNATAQLGNGGTTTPSAGTLVEPNGDLDLVTAAAGGGGHTVVVANGTVYSWGKDDRGQLGRGPTYNPLVPRAPQPAPGLVSISEGRKVIAVAAGAAHSLALAEDGSVWAWGDDSAGQLGDGDATLRPKAAPVRVLTGTVNPQPLTGVIAIAAGANHNLALKSDFTVWAWGSNTSGQLGNGTYLPSTTAAAVPGILSAITGEEASGVKAIAAGPNHSLAIVDGKVVAWGDNTNSQLGTSNGTPNSPIATQVAGISGAKTVAGGDGISLATTDAGTVMSWGLATRIGRDGANVTPGPVSLPSGSWALAARGGHVLALDTGSGAVWSWGNNGSGQLGRSGATTNTPSEVPSVTSATVIAVGDNHSLAVVKPRASATPSRVDFGNVTVHGSPVSKVVTISNDGPGRLWVQAPALGQPDFTASGCSSPVGEGSTCELTITFKPTTVQAWTLDVTVVSNNFAGDLTVQVTGAGVLPAGSLDITTDTPVVPSMPSAVPLGAIPINPQAPDFPTSDLPSLRLGDLPSLRLGDLPSLRLGDLPSLRLGDLGSAARAVLGQITLNQVPISFPGGWAAALENTSLAGLPLQNVTYLQLTELPEAQKTVLAQQLSIGDIFGFPGSTSSPFGSVGLIALFLGRTTTDAAPLPLGGPDWCARLENLGHPNCGADLRNDGPNGNALDASPFELDLAGVPYGPVNADGAIPIDQIRFGDVTLAADAPLGQLHLAAITPESYGTSDLGAVELSTILNLSEVVDCDRADCIDGTLHDAAKLGAIKADATFSQLGGSAVDNLRLGNIVYGLLPPDALNIDGTPLGDLGILGYRPGNLELPSDINYRLTFTSVSANATIANPTVAVTLPAQFTFVPDSATASVVSVSGDSSTPVSIDNPTLSGQTVTWSALEADIGPGDVLKLDFKGQPGLELGSFAITEASLKDGGSPFVETLEGPVAPVRVIESLEQNGTAATATPVQPDTLTISHVSTGLDKDYFSVPMPAKGTIVSVRLSHLPADYDLSVYFPAGTKPAEPSLRPSVEPSPRPLSSLPDVKVGSGNLGGSLASEQHDDIDTHACAAGTNAGPTCANLPLAGVSQNRQGPNAVLGEGTNETVELVSPGGDGNLVIEVAGYGQASSFHPYGLRVHETAPPADVVAAPRPFAFNYGSGTPAAVPLSTKTLFLSAPTRLAALYGAQASQNVTAAIDQVIGDPHVGPAVGGTRLDVDADAGVQAAYEVWDRNPYSFAAANDVVRAINVLIDRVLPPAQNRLENVVIVGTDEVIPFGRVFEANVAANERQFAAELADEIGAANAIVGSVATGHILSDDPFVGTPVQLPGRFIYTSAGIARGRLVDTAGEIQGALDRFRTFGGKVDPKTALTTGYDFMSDQAEQVASILADKLGAENSTSLISPPDGADQWTRQQLLSAYTEASPIPDIISINGHSDATRTLPPAETTMAGLVTTRDLLERNLDLRFLFTMGCHTGLSLADVLVSAPTSALADWAQVQGAQGAAGFVGQTGYGVGTTDAVAYSEELMVFFAQHLGTMSAGQALAAAKSDYYASTATFDAVHEKTMMQATYFGMPNYTFETPLAPASTPAALPTSADPATGLRVASIHTAPAFNKTVMSRGVVYDVAGDVQKALHRPLQPRVRIDVTQPGERAHGALITGLVSVDNPDNPANAFDPVLVSPVLDQQAVSPEVQTGDIVYPAAIQSIGSANGRDQLTLVAGRFMSCALNELTCPTSTLHETRGNQRLFTSISTVVHYSACASFTPPTFDSAVGTAAGVFAAHVTPAPGSTVKRVVVMVHDATGWKKLDLGSKDHVAWSGSTTVGPDLEFFMQAVDSCGNVALTTNKGMLFQQSPFDAGVFTFGLDPATPESGWFTKPVQVTVGGANQITYSLNGAPYTPYTAPIPVSTDGVNVLTVQGWNDAGDPVSGSVNIPVDSTPPTATVTTPEVGAVYGSGQDVKARYSCGDVTSGIKSCIGKDANGASIANGDSIDTSPGLHSFQVVATDMAGNTATVTVSYRVEYEFIGFLNGVSNTTMNAANAGRTIPMKWQLKDAAGNYVTSTSVVKSTTSFRINCDGTSDPSAPLPTPTSTKPGLSYDSKENQFNYGWATEIGWLRTCRRFVLVLDDSSIHTADFKFS